MSEPAQGNRQHVVLGQVPDLDHARTVFHHLQSEGVDANDVRLAGSLAPDGATHSPDHGALDHMDPLAIEHIGRQAEAGALIGALSGAAIGAGGGFLATAGDVGGSLALFLAVVFVFTGLGAWVAATISATRSIDYDDTWELTIDEADGSTWIAVRVRNHRDAVHTRHLLEREGIALVEERTAAAVDGPGEY